MSELTIHEIGLLSEQYQLEFEENYEMMALAFQLGYVNANTKGKNKVLFPKKASDSKSDRQITHETREKELAELKEMFNLPT